MKRVIKMERIFIEGIEQLRELVSNYPDALEITFVDSENNRLFIEEVKKMDEFKSLDFIIDSSSIEAKKAHEVNALFENTNNTSNYTFNYEELLNIVIEDINKFGKDSIGYIIKNNDDIIDYYCQEKMKDVVSKKLIGLNEKVYEASLIEIKNTFETYI